MNKQFGELVQQYEQARNEADVQKQDTILSEMRQNLKERADGVNFSQDEGTKSIMDASYEDLLKINGAIILKESSNSMTSISDYSRQTHEERNQYGPNNPYPSQD